jgi:hypothetical protein
MKVHALLFPLIISILVYGCYASRELAKYEGSSECNTVITGYYDQVEFWNTYYPAIVLKNGYLKVGVVISYDKMGITFVEKTSGIFDKQDTVFIPFNDLQTIVNGNGKLVYGKIPRAFSSPLAYPLTIWMRSATDTTAQAFNIQLTPYESFSYCIKPDFYYFLGFRIGAFTYSVDMPLIGFRAAPDSVNNLGKLLIAPAFASDTTVGCVFSYKDPTEDDSAIPFLSQVSEITGYLRFYQIPDDSLHSLMRLPVRRTDIRYKYLSKDKREK